MAASEDISNNKGIFKELVTADIPAGKMKAILESIDELNTREAILSSRDMKLLYAHCKESGFLSLVIKELLIGIYKAVYNDGSKETSNLEKAVSEYSSFSDRLEILRRYVYIDGINANGRTEEEEKAFEAERLNDTVSALNEDTVDTNDTDNNEECAVHDPDTVAATETLHDLDAEPMQAVVLSEYPEESSTESEPDVCSELPEAENNPVETKENTLPADFGLTELPGNLTEAEKYYSRLKEHTVIIEANADDGEAYFAASICNSISEGTAINASDDVKVTMRIKGDSVAEDFFLLMNDECELAVRGSFKESEKSNTYYMEADEENISCKGIKRGNSMYTIIFSNEAHTRFFRGSLRINCVQLEKSDKVLCVDFGTSNTTAGIYTDKVVRTVNFVDVTDEKYSTSSMCPTLVYVKQINSVDRNGFATDVDFLFGYEAKKVLVDDGYDPQGDMFFEIKRWIMTPGMTEQICDGKTSAVIRRKDIIKGYLRYILKCAENDIKCRFTKFHFSAPVKLKDDFIYLLQDYIFPAREGFSVMNAEDSIDEGVAIVYNHISESIIKTDREDISGDETHSDNIMIIDCGGGTTDLVRSSYFYRKTSTGYRLDLETKFENGNSNFGGNNITYRIFQLLKIKLAAYYSENGMDVKADEFIDPIQNNVLNEVDRCVMERLPLMVYDKLDEESRLCEEILPTDFNGDSDYASETNTRQKVKRNFYLLWQLAEEIKLLFFNYSSTVEITLDDNKETPIPVDTSNIYYYIRNPENDFPPLVSTKDISPDNGSKGVNITVNEINMLIRPDIYYLLSTILRSEENDLGQSSKIRLSGQSCKISLFQELLKEFVPGRKLRTGMISGDSSLYPKRLKMDCVTGCITYVRDKYYHLIDVNNIPVSQNIIYDVTISRGVSGEMSRTLFRGADFRTENGKRIAKQLHIEPYSVSAGMLHLTVMNTTVAGRKEYEFDVEIGYSSNKRIFLDRKDQEEYNAVYQAMTLREKLVNFSYNNINDYKISGEPDSPGVIDDIISRIRDYTAENGKPVVLVFAVPNKEGYGMVLYQIIKSEDDEGRTCYYEACWKRIPFESGAMNRSFFSGRNCVHDK